MEVETFNLSLTDIWDDYNPSDMIGILNLAFYMADLFPELDIRIALFDDPFVVDSMQDENLPVNGWGNHGTHIHLGFTISDEAGNSMDYTLFF